MHSADDGAGRHFRLYLLCLSYADASLVVVDKNKMTIYLEEDMSITATAGATKRSRSYYKLRANHRLIGVAHG